ncbi:hypothetical protein F5X98DRAFT_257501 [Xylaria grammica]|nr:hypothetical protein F5X98DRAFT_257501 [Xylaria grammica]
MKISRDKPTCFNSDWPGTRSSIFEYISRFRTEGGGYGDPENDNDNVTGNINVPESDKTTHKPLNISRNVMEHPIVETGSVADLLYPITMEVFNFAFDDEMLDLPLFNMDHFGFNSFNIAPR